MLSYSGGTVQTGGSNYNPTYSDTCTWQRYAYPITAGNHTIKFSFIKDAYVGAGSDCAKLDNIIWPTNDGGGIAPMPEGILITAAGLNANSTGNELETANFSFLVERGERIRVSVTSSAENLLFPNPGTKEGLTGTAVHPARNTLHFGGEHPSCVILSEEKR